MRIVGWNVCSLVQACRLEFLSGVFRAYDIVLFAGTRLRCHVDRDAPQQITRGKSQYHEWAHFGYARGAHTNRSAGVSIGLGSKWRKAAVVDTWFPPLNMAGRGAAARITGRAGDVLAMVLYLLVRY